MADKSLGKKLDKRLAKGFIKSLQGIDNKDANEMRALMNEVLKGGYKPVKKIKKARSQLGEEMWENIQYTPAELKQLFSGIDLFEKGGDVKPLTQDDISVSDPGAAKYVPSVQPAPRFVT